MPQRLVIFPPAPRYSYWPLSVVNIGLAVFMVHLLGLLETAREYGFWSVWPLLAFGMILPGLLLASAVFFLFVPFGRVQVEVGPEGLMFVPVSGRQPRVIRWGELDEISCRVGYKRPNFLEFRISRGASQKRATLHEDLVDGTLKEVLRAIEVHAPEGGYVLKGNRLDVDHWGGEQWRLVPIENEK